MAYMNQKMKTARVPAIKAVLKKYKMKGTISVRNHSTLVVTLKSGVFDFGEDYIQVNTYHLGNRFHGKQLEFMDELKTAMLGNDWYDNSDQTDYFHDVAFYVRIHVGDWNKGGPYQVIGE